MKRILVLLTALATALALAIPAIGAADDGSELASAEKTVEKGEFNSYIVVMKADPLVVSEGKDNLNTGKAKKKANELKKSHKKALEDVGLDSDEIVQDYVNSLNGFSATLTHAEALKVAGNPDVAIVVPDELQQPTTDSSPTFIGLDGAAGPWSTGLDGEGVVVGVIDSGIWPEHPSFADNGMPAPPIDVSSLDCDFGNTAHNPADAAFTCNNKLIGARQMLASYRFFIGAAADEFDSARDDNGHGTHTASTAAGNAGVEAEVFGKSYGDISGIAPRAHVIAYKGLGNLGGFTSDLAAAIDQAVADGVDVINYSVGGGAANPGADEISFLFAAAAGVHVATSAGNSGSGAATLGNPGTMPWMTTVGASTQSRFIQGTIELGNGDTYVGASITPSLDGFYKLVDGADAGNDQCLLGSLDPNVVEGNIVLCRRGASARAAKSLAVQQAGGVGMIHYENSDVNNLFTDSHWVPTVHIDNTPGLEIKAYIASEGDNAMATIRDTGEIGTWDAAPSMALFSSRGPNPVSPDLIKPDITAPGFQIMAGYSPYPDPGSTPPGELFAAIAGTSMSSPHVAGLFALIEQAHPDWSPAMSKSALMTTAHQNVVDNDRVSQADPWDFGAGHANPGNAVHKGSAFQPGLVYDAGLFEYAAYTCGEGFGVFSQGSCDFLEGLGVPSDPSDLNLPSIGVADVAGVFTVTRTVTSVAQENGNRTYTANIESPPGYTVTANPSSITLKRGESATFEVEIVNNTAPVGDWRFGSLTWEDNTGNYSVRSPIAVKASALDAPSEVAGSGTEGSVDIPVLFGYTGEYDAAAHGLVANQPLVDTVTQDPDQTFSPSDVGNGATAHSFDVADAAFMRITLDTSDLTPADPAIDIDLFLYRNGSQVASSTSGSTHENIEMTLPADGSYTLYVHGWQAAGFEVGYSVNTWVVPLEADTGSLQITSEPENATIGELATVTASWSGLAGGTDYLGAVSHSDGSGLLGLTLVAVNTE